MDITFNINMAKEYPCFEIHGGEEYMAQARLMLAHDTLLHEGGGLYSIVGWAPTADELIKYLEDSGLRYKGN